MRTLLFLTVGFLLLGSFHLLGRLFVPYFPLAPLIATAAYIAMWLSIASFNLWVGVARAGYSVTEELPILILIFGLPAALALLLLWKAA
jgi:hypothetical protein